MATINRTYKWTGYNDTQPIYGVTSMGTPKDALLLTSVVIRRVVQFDNTQTDASTVDYQMGAQGWTYDP